MDESKLTCIWLISTLELLHLPPNPHLGMPGFLHYHPCSNRSACVQKHTYTHLHAHTIQTPHWAAHASYWVLGGCVCASTAGSSRGGFQQCAWWAEVATNQTIEVLWWSVGLRATLCVHQPQRGFGWPNAAPIEEACSPQPYNDASLSDIVRFQAACSSQAVLQHIGAPETIFKRLFFAFFMFWCTYNNEVVLHTLIFVKP
jgi:hypothetical protein